jgi:CRP-like cAMP-binding protein
VARGLFSNPELESGESLRALQRLPPRYEDLPAPLSDPVLSKARFLQGLSSSEKNTVLQTALFWRYRINSVVIEEGDPANRLFLLLKGSARHFFITPEGRKVNLFWLVPGDIFGGACLLAKPAPFIVSTEVTKESQVFAWERDAIRTLAARYPTLAENGLSIAYDYFVWYVATHLSLVCHSARERLAHVLFSLSHGIGQKCANGISLEITNEQLANTANITLFTVSRLLSEWQKDGSLLKSRGRIVIRYPEQLFKTTPQGLSHDLKPSRFR